MKASTANPDGKPPSGDKSLGIDPYIFFYEIEEDDKTKEVEEAEILIIHNQSLTETKQNIIKKKFPYIDMFGCQGSSVVRAIRDLTVGVIKHLEIKSHIF